jgi:hypothetical protein
MREGPYSGITFWVHRGRNHALVGMWTGAIYYLEKSDTLVDLIHEVFHGDSVPKDKAPYSFPKDIVERYDLHYMDEFLVFPQTHEESLPKVQDSRPNRI